MERTASVPSASASTPPTAQEQLVLAEVLQAIRAARYGSVRIILQDAHAVQIDTLEKNALIADTLRSAPRTDQTTGSIFRSVGRCMAPCGAPRPPHN